MSLFNGMCQFVLWAISERISSIWFELHVKLYGSSIKQNDIHLAIWGGVGWGLRYLQPNFFSQNLV
jgi:hypothetical protein